MTAYDTVVAALDSHDRNPVTRNGTTTALCPAHDDHHPSLTVNRGADRVLVKCQSRDCPYPAIMAAIGLTEADGYDQPLEHDQARRIVATYDYTDERGELLYQTVRYDPKDFRQRRPDSNGRPVWNLNGVRRVLYRLPDVLAAAAGGLDIFVTEGEKDADAIRRADPGTVATCNPMGALKWRDEYTAMLAGAGQVIIVADKDQAGYTHARTVAASLAAAGIDHVVVEARTGKDAAEHLGAGHTIEELVHVDLDAPETAADVASPLQFITAAQLAADVDNAPPIGYLARPIWPADAYGVLAAEHKAGKTWGIVDLAVAVSAGRPWMGVYPVDRPGRVLVFLGEGGRRKMLRRFRAVAAFHRVRFEDLPIDVCFRAPHLASELHMGLVVNKLAAGATVLVIVDPLYLAARGANGSSLFEMGEHLERLQHVCQDAGSALAVVHHWNQTGRGTGAERMSGAGPAEWGRVLGSASVKARTTDLASGASNVILEWQFVGDEIPDTEVKVRRRVWADDPDDLNSPLHYEVEQLESDDSKPFRPTTLMERISRWLEIQTPGERFTQNDIERGVSGVAAAKRAGLGLLVAEGYVGRETGQRAAKLHYHIRPYRAADDPEAT